MYLVVRTFHVLAATIAVGAPVALALVLRARPPAEVVERLVRNAEYAQWGALGILVATGVGNIAAMGDALPGADSAWAQVLFAKLGAVLLLLAISGIRTFVIAGQAMSSVQHRRLGDWYAVTAAAGVVVVVLAEVLAHD